MEFAENGDGNWAMRRRRCRMNGLSPQGFLFRWSGNFFLYSFLLFPTCNYNRKRNRFLCAGILSGNGVFLLQKRA